MEEIKEALFVYDKLDFEQEPCADKIELVLGDNFEIKVENGKTYVVRKKPQYPKTYEECCKILNHLLDDNYVGGYKDDLLEDFQKLLICRDAYWKIAGDWKFNFDEEVFYLCNEYGEVRKFHGVVDCNAFLAFPSKEMRDAFYENFKDFVKNCKELL